MFLYLSHKSYLILPGRDLSACWSRQLLTSLSWYSAWPSLWHSQSGCSLASTRRCIHIRTWAASSHRLLISTCGRWASPWTAPSWRMDACVWELWYTVWTSRRSPTCYNSWRVLHPRAQIYMRSSPMSFYDITWSRSRMNSFWVTIHQLALLPWLCKTHQDSISRSPGSWAHLIVLWPWEPPLYSCVITGPTVS